MNNFDKKIKMYEIAYRWVQNQNRNVPVKTDEEIARMQTEDLIARLMLPKK